MKKVLFSIVLLLTCFLVSVNARKCSYDINKVDEFSGKKTKTTSSTLAKAWKISFSMSDDVYSIGLYLLLPGEINTAINKGDSLLIKLTSNEFIKLTSENDISPRSYVTGTGAYAAIVTDFFPAYQCSKQDIEKIAKDGISIVRVFIGTQFMEVPVKKKDSKKIATAASCLME